MNNRGTKHDKPVITIDYERYEQFLEKSDMTDRQKQELLQTLWGVITEFVSLGFGVHPLQNDENICGKLGKEGQTAAVLTPDMIDFKDRNITKSFKDIAQHEEAEREKGVGT